MGDSIHWEELDEDLSLEGLYKYNKDEIENTSPNFNSPGFFVMSRTLRFSPLRSSYNIPRPGRCSYTDWFEAVHKTIDYPYNAYFKGLRMAPHQSYLNNNKLEYYLDEYVFRYNRRLFLLPYRTMKL